MEQKEFEKYREALGLMFGKIIQDSSSTFIDGKATVGYYGLAISGLREKINQRQISATQLETIKKMWLENEKAISGIVGENKVKDIRDSVSFSLTILKTDVLIKGGCSCATCGLKGNICPGKRI